MKKISIIAIIAFCAIGIHAQVLTNKNTLPNIPNSNVMLDGSTSFSAEAGAPNNVGKGIIIPSVNLMTFQFNLTLADGVTFPTWFDGMIVYNNATGTTLAGQGVQTAVTPGFYYFYNPNATGIATGIWKPLGGGGAGEPWNVVGGTTQADSNTQDIYQTGKVGIGAGYGTGGSISANSTLEVNGAATNKISYNAGTGVNITFNASNLAYSTSTDAAPAFNCTGMKDGGTYTLAWQGAVAGAATVTTNMGATKIINNVAKTAGQHAVYTIVCINTTAYVYVTLF